MVGNESIYAIPVVGQMESAVCLIIHNPEASSMSLLIQWIARKHNGQQEWSRKRGIGTNQAAARAASSFIAFLQDIALHFLNNRLIVLKLG